MKEADSTDVVSTEIADLKAEIEESTQKVLSQIADLNDLDNNKMKELFAELLITKDPKLFETFVEYIKAHPDAYFDVKCDSIIDLDFSVGDTNLLNFIIDNFISFSYTIRYKFVKSLFGIKRVLERKQYELLDNIKEDALFLEIEPGKTVLEYLLDEGLLPPKALEDIYGHEDIMTSLIPKIMEKDQSLLKHISGHLLVKLKIGEVSALEYLFQNKLIDSDTVKNFYGGTELYLLCEKYDREDLLPFLREGVLAEKIGDKTILELCLDKGIELEEKHFYNKDLIIILIGRRQFKYLMELSESSLLEKFIGETTILEMMLKHGVIPDVTFLTEKESLAIFLKYGIYDKVKEYRLDVLLSLYDLNQTFLDYICEQIKQGLDFKLSSISTMFTSEVEQKAQFYITIARHGLIEHVDDISDYELTKDNGALIKELLRQDKELTMNTVLSRRVREKFDIAVILRMYNADQKEIKIDLHSMGIVDSYFEQYNSQFRNLELDEESKSLLEEFKSVMLADDLSDPKLIDAYVTSYTYLLATHNPYGERELRKIIEIKKANLQFCIVQEKDNSYYQEMTNSVHLETICLSTLNHETGHALYHNLTDAVPPADYARLVYEIRNNPETIAKVGNYSAKFHEIRDRVEKYVEEHYMKDYHLTDEEMASLDEFLAKQKEEKKKAYLEKGYDEQTIDTILNGVYSKEEYLEQDRRIKKNELIDAIMRTEYGSFIAIGDILDAIYGGQFRSDELRNRDYNVIEGAYGHGIAYYDRGIGWAFDETMANFSAIAKSDNAREILNYLREMLGEEFVDLISNYYEREITLSTKDLNPEEAKVA